MRIKYYLTLVVFLLSSSQMNSAKLKCNISSVQKYSFLEKEKSILEIIGNEIIAQNKDYIITRNKVMECKTPFLLNIHEQKRTSNDFKFYVAYFSNSGLHESNLPTHLSNKQEGYIAAYLNDANSLLKQDIPETLFEESQCYGNENSWLILLCDETYECKVINMGLVPHIAIKQFQDFSCIEKEEKKNRIEIEDVIVDTVLMNEIMQNMKTVESDEN